MRKTDKKEWNPEQLAAITSRGGDLLVSAAAGSGKTAVLVERVIRMLTDEDNPIPADRLLIVTFMNLAAAEMKTRIINALGELSEKDPGNENLRRQQLLMERAHISTIHSFCLDIVQENFSVLGIQPDCRICDEQESTAISAEALSEIIESYYEESSPEFTELVENIAGGKNDSGLENYVLALYEFLVAVPHYEEWLSEKLEMYTPKVPAGKTIWGKVIFEDALSVLKYCRDSISQIKALCPENGADKYIPMFEKDEVIFDGLIKSCETFEWDSFRKALYNVKFEPMPTVRGFDCDFKDLIKNTRDGYKKAVSETLVKNFSTDEAGFSDDIARLLPCVKCLFEITVKYAKLFFKKKCEKHLLDFSDLEQLTVSVLTARNEKGEIVPSETAKSILERFDYILVDEFQDTNKVQDTIFNAISKSGNRFFVGDVKQSIYRFRQAMPELFLEKRKNWKVFDGENYPATIILGKNYRSRKNIAGAVNFIFSQIMHSDCVEIEYDESEKLVPQADYPEDDFVRNEFYLIDSGSDTPVNAEAEFVANHIYDMVKNKVTVSEKGISRPCQYSDICILLRSMKNQSDVFASALRKHGIPYSSDQGSSFLYQPEITAVTDVLKAVDNPLLDIPLCGAMLSEIFAFTPDEISRIRLLDRKASLYSAVKLSAENGDEKSKSFLKTLESIRRFAAFESADNVISRLYSETFYPQIVQGAENGDFKLANLRLLVKYAADREEAGSHGLSSFLRYIRKIEEKGRDLKPAAFSGADSGAVRIMSVHHSKGLEFPVVFLCGTSKQFNRESGTSTPYLNEELGFACPLRDKKYKIRYNTALQIALGIKIKQYSLSEEMRILYVALTRAKENLIITYSAKNAKKTLSKFSSMQKDPNRIDAFSVLKAQSESDWILPALLHHPDAKEFRKIAGISEKHIIPDETKWNFGIVLPEDFEKSEALSEEAEKTVVLPDEKLLSEFSNGIKWKYKFPASEHIPVKAGVSSLTHQGIHKKLLFSAKPSESGALSGAERGTALHTFMQFCDFEKAAENPENEIKRLVDMKFITQKQADTISEEKIAAFFKSSLYERIKCSTFVRRELRFLQSLPANELGYEDASPDDKITVQGVADCVFEENGKIVVVDYKTDYVDDISELSERYSAQLIMYERLLEKALGKEVSGAVIWSFHFGKEIEI